MPFSTSFCLTNTGNLPSNTTLSFYSNADGYTVPFQTTVPLLSVTGANCPYILTNVLDGTTTIKVQTSAGNCCAVIDISPNNPCSFCNIGFDYFLPNTISQIVAGNLTGSCDSVISDYRIEWYEISNPNSPVYKFTTGPLGTLYGSISYTHPLVGTTAVPVLNGLYKPVLTKVNINGINYSSTSGVGLIQADLNNCFSNVTVTSNPLTCENGPVTGNYSHVITFSGASEGIPPPTISVLYRLGPNTKYLAWIFNGYDVPDKVKITYYGSYYNNTPIVLEYYDVGRNLSETNFNLTLNPKTFDSGGRLKKVTNISNIVRSVDDYILIDIIPNSSNQRTNFDLKLQCLNTIDCSTCWDDYFTQPQKILGSSIKLVNATCGLMQFSMNVSGCSTNSLVNTDTYKYLSDYASYYLPNGDLNFSYKELRANLFYTLTSCDVSNYAPINLCAPSSTNTIIFTKTNSGPSGAGNILIQCSSISDFNAYYNSYLTQVQYTSTYSSDPTNPNYYQLIVLKAPYYPNPLTASTDTCGDATAYLEYFIHRSSVVTTGNSNGYYFMNITMPKITKQIFYTDCQSGCNYKLQEFVNEVNSSSTQPDNVMNVTNQRGYRYTTPFYRNKAFYVINGASYPEEQFKNGWTIIKYITETIPYSGSPLTTIPSLSASTCPHLDYVCTSNSYYPNRNLAVYNFITMYYIVRLTDPNNLQNFEILTLPFPYSSTGACNFPERTSPNWFVIYKVQNGQILVSDPNYIINPPQVYTVFKRYNII